MESLISYKDPLFGVIILSIIITIISIINFSLYKFRKYKEKSQVEKILNDFYEPELEDKYANLLYNEIISIDFLIDLMKSSYEIGNFDKTISIGMSLIKHIQEPLLKQRAIKTLALTYCKIGFLMRSINLFKESLYINPEDTEALKCLVFLFDKINKDKEAIQVLESLQELNVDIEKYTIYFEIKKIIQNKKMNIEKKIKKLKKIIKKYPYTNRVLIDFFIKNEIKDLSIFLSDKANAINAIDIIYSLKEKIPNVENYDLNQDIKIIFMIKGWLKSELIESSLYQLDTLLHFALIKKEHKLQLAFGYSCHSCKKPLSNYTNICPYCLDVFSIITCPLLKEKSSQNEKNQSLQ